jgi:hypothetical protein
MPSTLEQFTRELKYLGTANTMWEVHARQWLEVSKRWGGERAAEILYTDGTNKGVWTDLFSQATKVSSIGRVMPGLELIAFHSGYGVPLWMATSSGRAPLVTLTPKLLAELEQTLEGVSVGRIVVIDAEGNSLEYLRGLEQGTPARGWVTRLQASWVKGLQITRRTSYQPYRNGDRVRMGEADLGDAKSGPFPVRVIEIERRSKGTVTCLAASKLLSEKEWPAAAVADTYFNRWPMQEANFRAVNQAVGFKDVHGYGKQLVDNISVVSELGELERSTSGLQERVEAQAAENAAREQALREADQELRRKQRQLERVKSKAEAQVATGERITPALKRWWREVRALEVEIEKRNKAVAKKRSIYEREAARLDARRARIAKNEARREVLQSRRKIFQHDVELDSIFNVLKVGLVMLVTYLLKEYLGGARMEPVTFLERIATLPARLRRTPHVEILTFEYSRRDPDAMALLSASCDAINARELRTRSGRILRIGVDPAPAATPPPRPHRGWAKTRDRIGEK